MNRICVFGDFYVRLKEASSIKLLLRFISEKQVV